MPETWNMKREPWNMFPNQMRGKGVTSYFLHDDTRLVYFEQFPDLNIRKVFDSDK